MDRQRRRRTASEEAGAGARPARGGRRVRGTARGGPSTPLLAAAGGALVVVIALVTFLLSRDGSEPADRPAATSAAAAPAAPEAAPLPPPGDSPPPPQEPPPQPAFDRADFEARLAACASAAAAIALGEEAQRAGQPAGVAALAWERAFEIDPADPAARAKADVRALDPVADFAGLDDIRGSPQTWMLRPWLRMKGELLSRAQREERVARWQAELEVIEARVAEAADDPFLTKIDQLRNDLASKPFFEDFDYFVIERTRPYALFVEVWGDTLTERDARREAVEEAYTPYLAAYDATIHRYLCRLSPAPPRHDPTMIVFILKDRASYERFFLEFEGYAAFPGMRAHYTPLEKWSFTYAPDVRNVASDDFKEGTQSLLHEITHAWVDRLATNDDGRTYSIRLVQTHWFNEGIAEFMSCHFEQDGEIRFQPWRSMRIGELSRRPPGLRIPFEQALRVSGGAAGLQATASAVAISQEVLPQPVAMGVLMSGFYADMSTFIFWLNYGAGSRHKRAFEEFARKELAGEGGAEAADRIFREVLALPDLEAQVDEFQKQVARGALRFGDAPLVPEEAAGGTSR